MLQVGDCTIATDCRHRTFVLILKRLLHRARIEIFREITRLLYRYLRKLRTSARITVVAIQGDVAQGKNVVVTFDTVIGIHHDTVARTALYGAVFD